MFKRFLILAVVFLFSINAFPQNLDSKVKQGLNFAYNFNWKKAEDVFKEMIDKYPQHPAGYHYLSGIYLWYYLGNKNPDNLKQFEKYSDLAVEKGKKALDNDEDNFKLKYLIGANYNYRAITFAKAGNYLDAAWASNKSESYLDEVIESNPKMYDAYLGLGLYNLAVAQIPAGFSWALKIAGISGNMDKGVEYIKLAAEKGDISKVEAKYYLSQILSEFLFNYKSAAYHLTNLNKQYPENIIFNYALAVVEMKRRNLSQAEKILTKIIKKDDKGFKQITAFSKFLLGDIYFRRNDFEKSAEFYMQFLNAAPDNDYNGIAAYRLGLSREIMGDRGGAETYFLHSSTGNMDLEDDIYARRKGNTFYKRKLSADEIKLIRYSNLAEAGKYKHAIDSLTVLVDSAENEIIKAEAFIYLSDAAFQTGKFAASLDYALSADNYDSGEEKWIKPFAYFYAARANKKLGNEEAAAVNLEEADNFTNYDYQNKLKNMLKVMMIRKDKNE